MPISNFGNKCFGILEFNNISFNVNVSDYEFVDLFGDAPCQQLPLKKIKSPGLPIICCFVEKSSSQVFNKLANSGILVRQMNVYGIKNSLRVTIGNNYENKKLITALRNIFNV